MAAPNDLRMVAVGTILVLSRRSGSIAIILVQRVAPALIAFGDEMRMVLNNFVLSKYIGGDLAITKILKTNKNKESLCESVTLLKTKLCMKSYMARY